MTVVGIALALIVTVVVAFQLRLLLDSPRWSRRMRPPDRRPHVWRERVGLVLAGALVASAAALVLNGGENADEGPTRDAIDVPDIGGRPLFDPLRSPAMDDSAWAVDAQSDFFEVVASGSTYTPYVTSSLRDYSSPFVNVRNRMRESYQPPLPPGTDPVDVWFFGASTLFGFTGQRDDHTVPSAVARLAEVDGLPIRVRNYGSPGYVNFQEAVLLLQLLLAGERPDMVVFYDGINDIALQVQAAYGRLGNLGELGDLGSPMLRRAVAGEVTGSDELPSPLVPREEVAQPPQQSAVVDAIIESYGSGLELVELLADAYGFATIPFWQPDLFTKTPLHSGEQQLLADIGFDRVRFRAVRELSLAVVDALPADVVDLSSALDDAERPVLMDQAHTNELGARLAAGAMYRHLRPELERLAAEG